MKISSSGNNPLTLLQCFNLFISKHINVHEAQCPASSLCEAAELAGLILQESFNLLFKFRLFKEPRITQIKQMKPVLYVMIPGRYYTDSVQHASQVLTDKLAERHSKAA